MRPTEVDVVRQYKFYTWYILYTNMLIVEIAACFPGISILYNPGHLSHKA